MTKPTSTPAYDFISASLDVAAVKIGLSKDMIRAAIKRNDLVAHYLGTKPVVRAVDLDEWICSLPTEPTQR